jgi:hypothetical protein
MRRGVDRPGIPAPFAGMNFRRATWGVAVALAIAASGWAGEPAAAPTLPRLQVSEDRRMLVRADGTPFF